MLKKENRLKTVLLRNPNTLTSSLFTVKVMANHEGKNRFAFVVSKRLDKRAVVRNSLKKKFRGAIEQIFDNIEKSFDFVFYPKQTAIKADKGQVLDELKKSFSKNNLIK